MEGDSPWKLRADMAQTQAGRTSLGQVIARSTSAPPAASDAHNVDLTSDLLVGNDLLEYVTKGYGELTVSTRSTTPLSTHSNALQQSQLKSPNFGIFSANDSASSQGMETSARSPAPSFDFRNYQTHGRPTSASNATAEPFFQDFGRQSHHLDDGLVRSQSAAPSFHSNLGPPPGMSPSPHSLRETIGLSRASSAGLPQDNAVRPVPKTFMDLIKEDAPEHNGPAPRFTLNDHVTKEAAAQSKSPGPPVGSMLPISSVIDPNPPPVSMVQQSPQRHVIVGPPGTTSGGFRASSAPLSEEYLPSNMTGQGYNMSSTPASMHQAAPTPSPIVSHQASSYYGGAQQHQQPPQGLRIPTQVMPSGHAVYMSPGPSTQQYGYATVYHSQQPQQQIIHQQIAGAPGDHYVSVLPVQNTQQQVAYWQHNGLPQQAVNQSSNGIGNPGMPVSTTALGHSMDSPSHYAGGRMKGNPRGRRGGNMRRGDAKSMAMTSPLLDEFRSCKSRDWTIRRIEGHIVEFCQDQNGSRFIQQRLEMGDVNEQQIVMKEVLLAIRQLRNDVFGNYVVQKLLDFGTPQVKADIRDTLEGEMLQLSLQMYGCRVVQKALEALDEDDLPRLLREFHHNVLSCIHDQNGNHVIQKCIEVLNGRAKRALAMGDNHRASFLREQIEFIVDDVLVNTISLSCHPYGCRVLQRILEHCDHPKKIMVLDEIKKGHRTLLDDQYGNYVIQHVLQYGRETDRDSILGIVVENGLLGLSRQKFASNVVEKLLKYGNGNQRCGVVREMLKTTEDPSMALDHPIPGLKGPKQTTVVLLMVRDAYANYVVQTTLDVVPESEERRLLLRELHSHVDELRNYTFAKHIVTKLTSLQQEGQ